ncbi:metalloregulator ArsR/SmtB family transcription factor [Catellatospora sp. NPDC049609]|uniref:ArsR/SmtB family transcription factor n=1 Tax=Catellatospora sp. NPDC049609 TaxID=3155505 RepID=UPI003419B9B4
MSLGDDAAAADDRRTAVGDLRALAHPIRLRILSLLTGAERSAAEIARELDITHANASYHLRQLRDSGHIEIAGEEKVRGGVARRYRYDVTKEFAPRPPGQHPTADEAQVMYAALAAELRRRARDVVTGPDAASLTTDAELWVDLEQWRALRDRVWEVSRDLHHAAKPPHTPGTVRVSATIAMFRMEEST